MTPDEDQWVSIDRSAEIVDMSMDTYIGRQIHQYDQLRTHINAGRADLVEYVWVDSHSRPHIRTGSPSDALTYATRITRLHAARMYRELGLDGSGLMAAGEMRDGYHVRFIPYRDGGFDFT